MALLTKAFLEKQFKNFAAKVDAVFSRRSEAGHSIDFTMDSKTYVITVKLLNESGGVLSTKSVDLPLESTVINGSYDEASKSVVLNLQNGNTIKIPVSGLISGFLSSNYIVVNSSNKDVLNSTKGTAFFNVCPGGWDQYSNSDLPVFQVDSGLDAFQITHVDGNNLAFRVNDMANGESNWSKSWPTTFKKLLAEGDALPSTGGTLTGDLTLSGDARFIKFASGARTSNAIKFYKGDSNGSGVVIGGGGRTIIGAGESADNLRNALGTTVTDETAELMHIAGDITVQVHTNCQTIAQRKTFTFGADGSLAVPSGGMFKGRATKAEHIMEVSLSGTTIDFHTWAETPANVIHNFGDTSGGETTIVRYHWSGPSGTFSNMHLPCLDSHIVIHAIPDTDSSGKLSFLWCTAYDIRSRAIYTCMKSVQTNGWTDWTALTGTDGVVNTAKSANYLAEEAIVDQDFRTYADSLTASRACYSFKAGVSISSNNFTVYHLPCASAQVMLWNGSTDAQKRAIAFDIESEAIYSCRKALIDGWADWVKITNEDGSPAASSGSKIYYGVCDTADSSGIKHVTIPGGFTNASLADGTLFAVRFTKGNSSTSTFSLAMGDATTYVALYGDESAGRYIDGTDLSVTRNYYLFMYDASVQRYRLLGPQTAYSKPSSNNLKPGSYYNMVSFNKQYLYSVGNLYILYLDFTIAKELANNQQYEILSIPYDAGIHNNYFDGRIYAATKNGKTLEFYMTSTSINIIGKSDVTIGDRVCVQYCFLNS